ncbi:C40 family peptidase [Nonomuraea sp. NBC_00507]|uniref:C40 family peptidase n=1 Tax=Nonomuraea sp. NBC_00507 TaxID=2976002 RepID=UPI002E16BFEF
MTPGDGIVFKTIAAGGGLITGIVLLAGMAGGGQYAAAQADKPTLTASACAYADQSADQRHNSSQRVSTAARARRAQTSERPEPAESISLSPRDNEIIKSSLQTAISLGINKSAVVADVATGLKAGQLTSAKINGDPTKAAEQIVTRIANTLCVELSKNAENVTDSAISVMGRGAIALAAALEMRGTPYSWGGGGPSGPSYGIGRGANTKGFDCSGLTEYAWARAGVRIGSTTYEQVRAGATISRAQIKPGDLIFYETDSSRPGPDHVGLAINDKEMVNAPYTGATVRIDPIDRPGYVGAARPG